MAAPPSLLVSSDAHAYGVAGSPVLPTTRIGAADGADTSRASSSPSTGQPVHCVSCQAIAGPKIGEAARNLGSSSRTSSAV
ncbi:hypothetical protein LUX32_45435 [Actinomadura madurae]|nr:hypothetical protein [Actinomadura madurae]MCP9984012.1 hypothetical protein [Actinomadura madurae]